VWCNPGPLLPLGRHVGIVLVTMKRAIQRTFATQFARPRGPLGQLAARIMRRGNTPLNLWIVDRLGVQPEDRVLEVGFGPGVALAELVQRASRGHVVGVDASASMVSQARWRHGDAVVEGRLDVREGDAALLPYDDATFDRACGTHVLYFWPDPVATVHELRRVLRSGGTLALGYQEREHMPPRASAGLIEAGARLVGPGDVEQIVRAAGFEDVRAEAMQATGGPAGFCVIGTK
jgi:SAM-dependent methyltransferase